VKGAEIAGERPGIGSDENATFAEYRIAGEARPLEEQCEVIRGVSGCGESLERPKASPFGELYVDVSTTGSKRGRITFAQGLDGFGVVGVVVGEHNAPETAPRIDHRE
jgi:hypothetical protein